MNNKDTSLDLDMSTAERTDRQDITEPTPQEIADELYDLLEPDEIRDILKKKDDIEEALAAAEDILTQIYGLDGHQILINRGLLIDSTPNTIPVSPDSPAKTQLEAVIQNATRAQLMKVLTRTGDLETYKDQDENLKYKIDPIKYDTEELRRNVFELLQDPAKTQTVIQVFKDYEDLPKDFTL